MTYAAIYRSTHPDVLTRLQRFDTERRAWSEAIERLWRDAGFPEGTKAWISHGGVTFGDRLSGMEIPAQGTAPKGWVAAKDRAGRYLPSRTSKVGREAQQLVAAVGEAPALGSVLSENGMPSWISYGLSWRHPAFSSHGTPPDEVWVGWSVDPDAIAMERQARGWAEEARRDRERVDADRWERVPLSDFWARVEAGEKPLPLGDDA